MFRARKDDAFPRLPATSVLLPSSGPCAAGSQYTESGGAGPSVPTKQRMPKQGGGTQPPSDYFKLTAKERAIPDEDQTVIVPDGPRPVTTKSAYNRLAQLSS
jgi:hypothetical protein